MNDDISEANRVAVNYLLKSTPTLIGVEKALSVVPGMDQEMLLHAGPPIDWKDMIDPLQGALIGAALYEGWAESEEEAEQYIRNQVKLEPNSHHSSAAPLAGVISPSMPVYVVRNEHSGNAAYTNLNEGLGKVLRFGAYGQEVIDHLNWMEQTLMPVLQKALTESGAIELKPIISESLKRGDECHNRNASATDIFLSRLAPALARSNVDSEVAAEVIEFITANEHTFLNISIPSALSSLQAAHGVEGSTLVTRIVSNGTKIGIQVSGAGNKWFTSPSITPEGGNFLEGYDSGDAAPVLGDSLATEATGLGGFAVAAAPAISDYLGVSPTTCHEVTKEMYDITFTEHDEYSIPALDGRGTPVGIDAKQASESGIRPVFNAGMAHRYRGVGQVGAGLGRLPLEPLERATNTVASN